jgi:hypothetical protein
MRLLLVIGVLLGTLLTLGGCTKTIKEAKGPPPRFVTTT